METLIASHSVSSLSLIKNPSLKHQSPQLFFHPRPNLPSFQPNLKLQYCFTDKRRPFSRRGFEAPVRVSVAAAQSNATDDGERWLLEPVGDGDSRHIGFKVAMPPAFEIASSEVIVGRVPEKANIVIPVATVSGTHARFQKKGGDLLVTDLGSTNGTFIDEKRLTPGMPYVVPPGRYITFGDTNLAIFRVSKLENMKPKANSSNADAQVELEPESASVESGGQNI